MSSRPRAVRGTLSRETIVTAALELADAGGLEAISMRAVGARLGVQAMSLYNHVANKADLLDGLHERLIVAMKVELDGLDWREAMRTAARAYRQVALDHPRAFVLLATRPLATPSEVAHIGPFLELLVHHGLDSTDQLFAMNVFFTALNGVLVAEVSPLPGHLDAAEPNSARVFTEALGADPALGPVVAGIVDQIQEWGADEAAHAAWFDRTVDVLLRGLTALIEPASAGSATEAGR